ncbi:polysaccharide deacetylase family protein [Raineyella fluvialis]|uniref:Polysaccharide deacetylase family protein n=1 Tax=Raineyella fluvialis TaxID=2662261 RepID=A0A5Q2FBH4_9ACTN|nr:polysaccharide deacetylase family protein [Raineyella fluvialis]QGF24088.1 polysaccharide deacetylase family protein [Raineyella fluvialis]
MRRGIAAAVVVLSGVAVTGCAPAGAMSGASSPSPVAAPVAPPPPPAPTDLHPGTNHAYLADAYAYPAADVHAWLVDGAKAANYPQRRIAFLTFDDGPSNSTTPKDLDILRAEGVPATFFYITGPMGLAKVDPAVPHRALAEGHAVCVHSRSHNYHELYPGRRADAEHVVADHERAMGDLRGVFGADFAAGCYRYPGATCPGEGWPPLMRRWPSGASTGSTGTR